MRLFPPHTACEGVSSSGNGDVATALTRAVEPQMLLRLVAGDWLCRSLLTDPLVAGNPGVQATSMFLGTMRAFGGTMRGRPFEMLCIDAFCSRALLHPNVQLRQLISWLGDSVLGSVNVPSLTVVAIPKVSPCTALSGADRSLLLQDQRSWPGYRLTLCPSDLPWLLSTWLPSGVIAVPVDAEGGAQDWFVRLENDIMGFANKAVGPNKIGTA